MYVCIQSRFTSEVLAFQQLFRLSYQLFTDFIIYTEIILKMFQY